MPVAEAAEAIGAVRPVVAIPMRCGYATGGDPKRFTSHATVVIP